jgi:hypothetical protein
LETWVSLKIVERLKRFLVVGAPEWFAKIHTCCRITVPKIEDIYKIIGIRLESAFGVRRTSISAAKAMGSAAKEENSWHS